MPGPGGPYQTKFETDNLTVAVVTPTPTRRDELMEWTRRELRERHLTDYAAIFLFTDADPTTLPPTSFFFDRHWRELPAPDPVSILDPLTGEVAVFHA